MYIINITFCPPVFAQIVCNLLDPDKFESDVSSVAELGYFYRIPDPKVSFPDLGQKDPGSGSAPMVVMWLQILARIPSILEQACFIICYLNMIRKGILLSFNAYSKFGNIFLFRKFYLQKK
jgi:hypothetical protein